VVQPYNHRRFALNKQVDLTAAKQA
jgi:hypothetical protein